MKKIFILLFSLTTIGVIAQPLFEKGFVIKNNRDTIYGFVDYRSSRKQSRICSFKETKSSKKTKFFPVDIKAYGMTNGKEYTSIPIVTKTNDTCLVFMENLVEGNANLYFCNTSMCDARFFIYKNDTFFYPLIATNEINVSTVKIDINTEINEGEKYLKASNNKYIGILNIAFKNCPELINDIKESTLTHKSLIELTDRYNRCSEGTSYINSSDIKKSSLGLFLGLNLISLRNYDLGLRYNYLKSVRYSKNVVYGFFLDVPFSNRYSMQIDALGFSTTLIGENKENPYYGNYDYYNDSAVIDLSYIKLPISMVYTYPGYKIQPYISLGITLSKLLKSNFQAFEVRERSDNFTVTPVSLSVFDEVQWAQIQYGFQTSVGVKVFYSDKKFVKFDVKYEKGSSFQRSVFSKEFTPNFYFTCGVSIF